MTKILVVDDDACFTTAIARDLTVHAFDVTTAATVEEAVAVLARAPIDVVLTDLRMGDRDGIDLLDACRSSAHPARAILMSAYASARDYDTALQLGAVRVLCKPFTPRELIDAIREAVECEHGFHGNVHGLSLLDILQMFHLGRRNATIVIGGSNPGRIFVQGGEIVHALAGGVEGEEAFVKVLSTRSGTIRTTVLGDVPRTIERSFESLVLDALRVVDEGVRDSQTTLVADEWSFERLSSHPPAAPDDGWGAARALLAQTAPALTAIVLETATRQTRVLRGELSDLEAAMVAEAFTGVFTVDEDVHCECVGEEGGAAFVRYGEAGVAVLFLEAFAGRDARGWFRSYTAGLARRIGELAPRGMAA